MTSITLDHRGRRRSVKSRVRLHHSTHERMRVQVKTTKCQVTGEVTSLHPREDEGAGQGMLGCLNVS
ncbi:hypothetical protein J6590_029252 [Homalodisca vitripennis]|nr:hypothetical protein J6590_029252 [Homalodisca vitripennis]